MLTLLGSLLGFVSSLVPELLALWRDKQDRKHELAILNRQLIHMRLGHQQRLEAIGIEADTQEQIALLAHDQRLAGSHWINALRGSVRPLITYAFFGLFALVKISLLVQLLQQPEATWSRVLPMLWDPETQALFAAVMSFWFGSRSLNKARQTL